MIQNQHINLYAQQEAVKEIILRQPFIFLQLCIFILLLFFSCKSTQVEYSIPFISQDLLFPYTIENIEWHKIEDGMHFFVHEDKKNKINYEVVKINLKNPNLIISSRKVTGNWQKSISVLSFAKETNSIIAINTVPFYSKSMMIPWSKVSPCGIVISEGKLLTVPNEKYSAIAFYFDQNLGWNAKIYDNQADILKESEFPIEAVGGFWTILREENFFTFKDIKDTRMAVGIDSDSQLLYLLAGHNLTYNECSIIFYKLGSDVAMEFDGGSSVQMTINRKNTISKIISRNVAAALGFAQRNNNCINYIKQQKH